MSLQSTELLRHDAKLLPWGQLIAVTAQWMSVAFLGAVIFLPVLVLYRNRKGKIMGQLELYTIFKNIGGGG